MRKNPNKKFLKRAKKPARDSSADGPTTHVDTTSSYADLFTKNASYAQHLQAQTANPDKYQATLAAFSTYSIDVLQSARTHVLAAAFARHDHRLIEYVLADERFTFTNVLKAITLLDSGRQKRALEKRLKRGAKIGMCERNPCYNENISDY